MSSLYLYEITKINTRTGAKMVTIRGLNHSDIMELTEGYTSEGSAPRWTFTRSGSRYKYIVIAY